MTPLLALVLGAGVGLGLLLAAAGVAGRRALPEAMPGGWAAQGGRQPGHLVVRIGVAIAVAIGVYALTGWAAASFLVAAGASVAPRALGGRKRHQAELAKVEAIAPWTEMLRDTMAAASGLEQAMVVSAAVAPAPIAPAVGRLAARLEHVHVPGALRAFADDVDHPIADFVVAGLIAAAEGRARELGPLLTQLAECARAEAQLRARIWAGRARTRTSVRVISGSVGLFALGLVMFDRSYLAPYASPAGQVALLAIGGVFAGSVVGMDRMSRIQLPERFVGRRAEGIVITALLLGWGAGLGVLLVVRAVAPGRVRLVDALTSLERPHRTHPPAAAIDERLGHRAARLPILASALDGERLRTDLRVTGRTTSRHTLEKLAAAIAGLAVPLVLAVLMAANGVRLGPGVVVVAALAMAAAGFVLPDLLLRDAAKQRRAAFTAALSSYLDLVNVVLAGGAGIETALEVAADAGDGWAFGEMRSALARSRALRQSPWQCFAELGDDLGIAELRELAASVQLAGQQGARVRASLAAKAASLRGHQLAAVEAAAHAASERMALPTVLMFVGFLLFIGYPAVAEILGSSGW